MELEHFSTKREYQIRDGEFPIVECMMGNGRRRVLADTVTVSTYPAEPGRAFVGAEGRTILRDGRSGRRAGVGWSIGGRWDETATAPEWVIAAARRALDGGA